MSIQQLAYQPTPISSEHQAADSPIPAGVLAYFRARLTNRIHELVLSEFSAQELQGKTSRARLARLIRRKPEQITRWLGSPGNWTIDTLSDLLLGIGLEPEISVRHVVEKDVSNPSVLGHVAPGEQKYRLVVKIHTAKQVERDIAQGTQESVYYSIQVDQKEPENRAMVNFELGSSLPGLTIPIQHQTLERQT